MSGNRMDDFFEAIDELCGFEGEQSVYESTKGPDCVGVSTYIDTPDDDLTTMFTFGLSNAENAAWKYGKPELILSVNGDLSSWQDFLGSFVLYNMHHLDFHLGKIVWLESPLVQGSSMNSLLVYPSDLVNPNLARIELDDRVVNLRQIYPIYESEIDVFRRIGVGTCFWEKEIDFSDVHRPPYGGDPCDEIQ